MVLAFVIKLGLVLLSMLAEITIKDTLLINSTRKRKSSAQRLAKKMSTRVHVQSTYQDATLTFEKMPNTGWDQEIPLNCLLISFKQAAHAEGLELEYKEGIKDFREEMAVQVLTQKPQEDSYKFHASLLPEDVGAELYSKIPSEEQYLQHAETYLSIEQKRMLDTLPTTISHRLEVATKFLDSSSLHRVKQMKFSTQARRLEYVMSLLESDQ